MKKSIMILGAGTYQVPLIKKAQEMGLISVVVSPSGDYPGIEIAEKHFDADITDTSTILQIARQQDISGIVTTGSDVGIPTLGAVVDALGLKGPSHQMAVTVSSKTSFRSFQAKQNLSHPGFAICKSEDDAKRFFTDNHGAKIVLKPDDASGSRGVSVILPTQSEHDLIMAYRNAVKYARNNIVCAEQFIEGREVGGDGFFVNGKLEFFTTTVKHIEGVVVRGHSLPGIMNETELKALKHELENSAERLGYLTGPVNFDAMINTNRCTIIEMGLRNGGNGIVDLIKYSENIDLVEWLINYSIFNEMPVYTPCKPRMVSSYIVGSRKSGILKRFADSYSLQQKMPEIISVVMAKKLGDSVEEFVHNANLIGYLIVACGADSYNSVCEKIVNAFGLEVE